MNITQLDHLVLTVADIQATCEFYERVLGMTAIVFGNNRTALTFGTQKINLHPARQPIEPKASLPAPGSADLCFLTDTPLADAIAHIETCGVTIEHGPVRRTGATTPIHSIYIRDPDGNLLEIANTISESPSQSASELNQSNLAKSLSD